MRLATSRALRSILSRESIHAERGSVLVEMALVLPILTLILLVAIDLGLTVREYQLLQNAVREGARLSSLPQYHVAPSNPHATLAMVTDRVVQYCRQENITILPADVYVNQNYFVSANPSNLRSSLVTASYDRPMFFARLPFVPTRTIRLTAVAVFRDLY